MPAHNPGFEVLQVMALPYGPAHEALAYVDTKAILREADAVVMGRRRDPVRPGNRG